MKLKLLDIINRQRVPQPWAEGEKIPWNDPGFSGRMLNEHLSQEHDAASRRFEIIDRHVGWIHEQVLGGNPTCILDLGCGPGLYTSRLAKLGHRCVGIDFSPASIAHAREHGESHELYKGILDDAARGVFNGKIYVHPHAQKTDAKQSNQALLLSDDACIDTKPQLEIYADDVKCTHGATVGQLDVDALFYLRSRGLSHDDAHNLLIYAFANELVDRLCIEPIRHEVEDVLLARRGLPRDAAIGESV